MKRVHYFLSAVLILFLFLVSLVLGDLFVSTFAVLLIPYTAFYFLYILINITSGILSKRKFYAHSLWMPFLIFMMNFLIFSFINEASRRNNDAVKQAVESGQYCKQSKKTKLTTRYLGVPKDYFLYHNQTCLIADSPSYSISKVKFENCHCDIYS